MPGLFDAIFGTPPSSGFDPSAYLSMMQGVEGQINSLYSNAPTSDVVDSAAFQRISQLLGPSADGSLSTPLMAMYNSGAVNNNLANSAATANVLSNIKSRGLAGSSIESQALENQSLNSTLANSSLLAQLYGLQNQNTSSLAGILSQGQEFDVSQNNALLNAHAAALGQAAGAYGGLASQGFNANLQSQLAGYQNQGNFVNSLLGAGVTYAMMPSAATAAPVAAGGIASMGGGLDLSGFGPGGYGATPYFTGGAGYGGAGYATPGTFS